MPDYDLLIKTAKDTVGQHLEADPWVYDDHLMLLIKREGVLDTSRMVRSNPVFSCEFFIDVTAVDYPGRRPNRFDVVYHWFSLTKKHRVRVKTSVPENDPEVDSIISVTKGCEWFERETWDMYGIRFKGHPDLRRILLYEEFEGHPLRKTHPVTRATPLIELRTPHKPEKTRWESIHGCGAAPMAPHPAEEAPGQKS